MKAEDYGRVLPDGQILAPGIGIWKLEDLKEAVDDHAFVKVKGPGYWTWAVTSDKCVATGAKGSGMRKGQEYRTESLDYNTWQEKVKQRSKGKYAEQQTMKELYGETKSSSKPSGVQGFHKVDAGRRRKNKTASISEDTGKSEEPNTEPESAALPDGF